MMKPRKWPFRRARQSLSCQISQAELRLDERRKQAAARALSLSSRIRSTTASPGGLWLAGCAGFMAAEWMHRPGNTTSLAPGQPSIVAERELNAEKSKTALLIEFALDLGMLWVKANQQRIGGKEPQ